MVAVTIKETGALGSRGSVVPAGNPPSSTDVKGPVWNYELPAGDYVFNVDFFGVAGNTTNFIFQGAAATSPTSFQIPGGPGTVGADTQAISFTA